MSDRIVLFVLGVRGREDAQAGHGNAGLHEVSYGELTAEFLAQVVPDMVISPFMTPQFDCFDLGLFLNRARYRGMYRAIGSDLPRPDVIRREIAAAMPMLDFDLVDSYAAAFES